MPKNKLRSFLPALAIVLLLSACGGAGNVPPAGSAGDAPQQSQQSQPSAADGKILIAYFTRANNVDTLDGVDAVTSASINLRNEEYVGNTGLLALWIQEKTGGELFSIEVEEPYSANYDETDDRANREQRENARPALTAQVENLEDYSTVFLGFPNWYYDMPMAVYSFLEQNDLSGKTIIPFCTSGGGRFSDALSAIAELQPDAEVVQDGLALTHNAALLNAQDEVNEWLAGLDGPWNDEIKAAR